jgi:hypothetical protein
MPVRAYAGLEGEDYYRFGLDAEHIRRLESGTASALRTQLAGPSMFAQSFCKKIKQEFPRAAACAEEFRAQARPQPSRHTRMSNLPPVPS